MCLLLVKLVLYVFSGDPKLPIIPYVGLSHLAIKRYSCDCHCNNCVFNSILLSDLLLNQ